MQRKLIFAVLLVVSGLPAHAADASPNVVVSLKPIHSLVAGVMGRIGEPRLIVPGSASPHVYQMRPSEAKTLREADIIIWIGENMETFLARAIENLGTEAEVVTLHEEAGIHLLPNRGGGIWDGEEAKVHVDEHHDHGHAHGEFDMHIWLDPGNARRIVDIVMHALARIDAFRAQTYRDNAAMMRERIAAQTEVLRAQLAPVRDRPFIVFHDGYRYFEHAFELRGLGAVAIDPARAPGAKRLTELRRALAKHGVRCVFTEPQFEPDLVQTVIEGTAADTAALDPIGISIPPGADAWFQILQGLGTAFVGCLGKP